MHRKNRSPDPIVHPSPLLSCPALRLHTWVHKPFLGSISIKVSLTFILAHNQKKQTVYNAANWNHHIWLTGGSPQVPQEQLLPTRKHIWELIKLGLAFKWGLCSEQIFPVSSVHEGAFSSLPTIPPGCHSQFQPEDSACTGHTCAGSLPSPDSTLRITAWVESWDLTDVPSIQHLPFPYFHSPLSLLPTTPPDSYQYGFQQSWREMAE